MAYMDALLNASGSEKPGDEALGAVLMNHISVLDSAEVRRLPGIGLCSDDEGDRGVAREPI